MTDSKKSQKSHSKMNKQAQRNSSAEVGSECCSKERSSALKNAKKRSSTETGKTKTSKSRSPRNNDR